MNGPSPADIERQIEWESHCVRKGVERYHSTLSKTSIQKDGSVKQKQRELGETQVGLKVITDVLQHCTTAIEEARQEAIEGLSNPDRRSRPVAWWWYIAWLSAEQLAFLTIRTILTSPALPDTEGRALLPTALGVGRAIRDEIDFRRWQDNSKRKAEETGTPDLAKILISRAKGTATNRTIRRWIKKTSDIETLDWPKEVRLQVGTKLIETVVDNSGGWFEIRLEFVRGKTERRVYLTDKARAAVDNMHGFYELNRPYLLPTIIPPKPWEPKAA